MTLLEPIRDTWRKRSSICSNGWSDLQQRPLINIMAASLGGAMFIMAVDSSDKIKDGGIYSKLGIEKITTQNLVQIYPISKVQYFDQSSHYSECRWVNDLVDEVSEVNNFILDHSLSQSIFNRYSNVMLLKVAETRFASNILVVESKRSFGKTMLDLDWKGLGLMEKKDPIKLKARKRMDLLVSET
ncbi:hypothetical protein CXB51_001354 [Gossypium anomalum]|uniref:DUF659 domain-containing protein n=1 Tax=Gossypium anomalum TaxID=47600 RepID=A0A8J5ZBN6_9ROSI|nr:hypothetical protein CXB51_001354 [Gossypium anomalum]